MPKILDNIKKTNGIAIFSFLLAIFAWIFSFSHKECSDIPSQLSGAAALMGIIALIWLKIKKQKGMLLAVLGIVIGFLGYFLLVTLC